MTLVLAAVLRMLGVAHDLPFSFYGDELFLMKRAMAMGSGDLDPHWFHKPALLMYLLLAVYGAYFVLGFLTGRFGSVAQFGASFLTSYGPFLLLGRLLVAACGVALVAASYLLARRGLHDRRAALLAALVTALLPALVASSVVIKSDIPGSLFVVLAAWALLGWQPEGRRRPLVLAALLAGVAMGFHYYALALVPVMVLFVAWRVRRTGWRWPRIAVVTALVPVLFVAGFALTSPFNFLDRGGAELMLGRARAAAPRPGKVVFEPDREVVYRPGPAAWAGSSAQLVLVLASAEAMTLPLVLLAALGLVDSARDDKRRPHAVLVGGFVASYAAFAALAVPYHVQPRHLCVIYALLAGFVWPGVVLVTAPVRRAGLRPAACTAVTVVVAFAALAPAAAQSAAQAQEWRLLDSRVVAQRWIVAHLPPGSRVLLDDYGPELLPDGAAVDRQRRLLPRLPAGPFTSPQRVRLALLARYPPPAGYDLDQLGHPWWLPREKSDAELRASPVDLDMANPLLSRVPLPIDEYRRRGYRYVITNSTARSRYFVPHERSKEFPSFVRFYDELARLRPLATFEPRRWGGSGPRVWVYDLGSPAAARDTIAGKLESAGSDDGRGGER